MNKIELLSPAGSFESLNTAIQNGADAIYLGGKNFNARHFADNFEDLEQAVSHAHLKECKIYFVLNTLVLDREIAAWVAQAQSAAQAGVDAFILQDIGCAKILRQVCPNIPLHASTQMTVHNTESAQALKKLGFSRVILARELTLPQIERITKDADIETEVFVHGALCVCYSGQCLMSSMLGGRSANRGECAQPCRLKYKQENKSGYLLNTKDLCLINYIKKLNLAGVCSLKIEGRMKSPEYVGTVTRIYKKAIRWEKIDKSDLDMLALAFNRGGFTSSLLGGDKSRLFPPKSGHMGIRLGSIVSKTKNDITIESQRQFCIGDEIRANIIDAKPLKVLSIQKIGKLVKLGISSTKDFKVDAYVFQTSSAKIGSELSQSLLCNFRKVVEGEVFIEPNNQPILKVFDISSEISVCVTSSKKAQIAKKRALTEVDVFKQLTKTGDTAFGFRYIHMHLAENTAFSASGLNALRRQALKELTEKILDSYRHTAKNYTPLSGGRKIQSKKLAAQVFSKEQADAISKFIDILYIPIEASWAEEFLSCHNFKTTDLEIIGIYPQITNDEELSLLNIQAQKFENIMTSGFININNAKIADFGMNIMNSEALAQLKEMGYTRATLSTELNTAQINDLVLPDIQTELIAYGRSTLMITEHCPIDCDQESCVVASGKAYITDRIGKKFPIIKAGNNCRVKLLNTLPVYTADILDSINADVLRLVFTIEQPKECLDIAKKYRTALGKTNTDNESLIYEKEYTRGHFNRGVGTNK